MDSLKAQLDALLVKHAGTRVNGSVASDRTSEAARDSLHASFTRLTKLGYHLQKPENLGEKHIQALCTFWHEKSTSRRQSKGICRSSASFATGSEKAKW